MFSKGITTPFLLSKRIGRKSFFPIIFVSFCSVPQAKIDGKFFNEVNGKLREYQKNKDVQLAEDLLKELKNKNQISESVYDRFIQFYGKLKMIGKMQETFDDMKLQKITPTAKSYSTVISEYGKANQLEKMEDLFQQMQQQKIEATTGIFTSMIHHFGKGRKYTNVEKLVKQMKQQKKNPTIFTYSTLISSYSKSGHLSNVIAQLDEMRLFKISPLPSLFPAVLNNLNVRKDFTKIESFLEYLNKYEYDITEETQAVLDKIVNTDEYKKATIKKVRHFKKGGFKRISY